jgi:hypothetical protein
MNNDASQADQPGASLKVDNQVTPETPRTWDSYGRISLRDWTARDFAEPEYMLYIAGIHQDAATGKWATQVTNQAIQLVGEQSVHGTWWNMGELGDPRVFRDAVEAATMANILVVSVRATDALPLDLYDWIEAWLPLRLPLAGVLVALIGVSAPPAADASRIGRYLQDVAWRGDLEFLMQDYELPQEFSGLSLGAIAGRASAARQLPDGIIDLQHWGINE